MPFKAPFTQLLQDLPWQTWQGVYACWAHHPLVFQWMKKRLQQHHDIKVAFGEELTPSWLEQRYLELSLFGERETFFIYHAEKMPTATFEYLHKELAHKIEDRLLVLCFSGRPQWKKELRTSPCQLVEFEDVRFWEVETVLQFLCQEYRTHLSSAGKKYLLEHVEHDLTSLSQAVIQLSLYEQNGAVSDEHIKSIFRQKKYDQFEMADLFAKRKFTSFFAMLEEMVREQDGSLLTFFSFMQSHLLKLVNPNYIHSKKKVSQYDRKIQEAAKKWDTHQLSDWIAFFSELIVMTKSKDSMLLEKVRSRLVFYL